MRKKRIGGELKIIHHMIKRNVINNPVLSKVNEMTGENSFIIGYLGNNRNKAIYQKDIEKRFSITRSTTSKILKLMEQKGLIERQKEDEDGRLKRIVLTNKSLELHKLIEGEIDQLDKNVLKGFSDKEINDLYDYLDRMIDNLKEISNDKNIIEKH